MRARGGQRFEMEHATPRLSVVIAARDAAATLDACLEAAVAQAGDDCEIIVVDDSSRDATAAIAERRGAKLIRLAEHRGVAAARNEGARVARAPVLLFLDADVVPARDLFNAGLATMTESAADALIGSYDDEPSVDSVVSRFKNLAHHYFHQNSDGTTTTFWGACGFIRREIFCGANGFDETRFTLPSIEDVELGARIARGGAKILIAPQLRVTHLKRWTLANLLVVDVTRRAIPWTILALGNGKLPGNLNFSWIQRLAAIVAVAELTALLWLLFDMSSARSWIAIVILVIVAIALNRGLYRLFLEKGGLKLAVCGFLLQQLYYLYSLCGFFAGLIFYLARRNLAPVPSR